jgi:hypothetical protein
MVMGPAFSWVSYVSGPVACYIATLQDDINSRQAKLKRMEAEGKEMDKRKEGPPAEQA